MMEPGIVKHVHITDNFGYTDAHLAPGMGNVPNKEVMEGLMEKGYEGRAIVEAGGFINAFKTSAFPYSLETLDSPIYKYEMEPSWEENMYSHYSMGHGEILPELHHRSLYGGGFASLPRELGGQMGGDRSRFAGTPNQ